MKDFIIFSIGPVQSYIAAARRSQDLWAGSRILSTLMEAALKSVDSSTIRYPLPDPGGSWPDSLPNRAVVVVPKGQGEETADKMDKAANGRWQAIANKVQSHFEQKIMPSAGQWQWDGIWHRQVDHWLEVYWVVYPWDESQESYGLAYGRAAEWLDARKLLRHFPDHCEYDVKSSLDGVYQALRGEAKEKTAREFWAAAQKKSLFSIRRGERLSAIDIVKRFAEDAKVVERPESRFPSTSSIASADFRLALMQSKDNDTMRPVLQTFVDQLDALVGQFSVEEQKSLLFAEKAVEPIEKLRQLAKGDSLLERLGRYEGDYFYTDFYTEARLLEEIGRPSDALLSKEQRDAIRDAARALKDLNECCAAQGIARPSIYYAVIAMDGDRMGQRLSHREMTETKHSELSKAMADFARDVVKDIVGNQYPGAWVYAGGDDVLALVPVSCALDVAEALRTEFQQRMSKHILEDEYGNIATLSGGIAIVHQQSPLQSSIEHARQAEQVAKTERDRKNYSHGAIVVQRLTRGGAPRQTSSGWIIGDRNKPVLSIVTALQQYIKQNKLSGKFAYELQGEATALLKLKRAHEREIARLLKRHSPEKERAEVLKLATSLAELAEYIGIDKVADWALVARFLAQGGQR